MMKTKMLTQTSTLLATFICLLINNSAIASEQYQQLTLAQAIDIAMMNNNEKKISLQAAAIAESQYQEALSARMPNISLQASLMRTDEDPTFTYPSTNIPISGIAAPLNGALAGLAGAGILPPGLSVPSDIAVPQQKIKLMDRDTAIAQIQLMYPLFTGGKISSIIQQADIAKDIAKQEYQRSSLQVMRDVKRYYYAAQLTQGLQQLSQETVESLEGTRDLTKSMYEAGSATVNKLDYLKTEMAVHYTRSLASEFAAKHQSAIAALQHAMGIAMDSQISLASNEFAQANHSQNYAQLFVQAQQFNPQLGMMKLAVNISDAKVTEAKSAYFPQIAITGNIRHIENDLNTGLVNSDNRNSWTIGVAMSMPLFDFGRTSNHVQTAKQERQSMAAKQVLVEQGLAAQIKHLFIQLAAANEQKGISEKASEYSKQHVDLTEKAYQIGMSKPDDMVQASLLDAITQGNYLKAQHDAVYHLAEIEYFIGAELQK